MCRTHQTHVEQLKLHLCMRCCAGAAQQFFCEVPSKTGTSTETSMASDTYDECVYREDTLVLLELTTRDMMEVHQSPAALLTCLGLLPFSLPSEYINFGDFHAVFQSCQSHVKHRTSPLKLPIFRSRSSIGDLAEDFETWATQFELRV